MEEKEEIRTVEVGVATKIRIPNKIYLKFENIFIYDTNK